MKGTVEGFLLPEIVISVILALIGSLCAVAGAAAIAARVTGVVSKIRKAFTAADTVGKVCTAIFRYIDDLFELIGRLSKALRQKIDEAVEGATGAYGRIVRKVRPRISRKKAPAPKDIDPERVRALATNHEQGGKLDLAEGTAGARLEAANGRTLTQSTTEGVDLYDGDRAVSLKGPLMNKETGEMLPINDKMVDGLANAAVKDLKFNSATNDIVIDTYGSQTLNGSV